ncbi:MAG: alpha/beta fold hydrolase, partial [Pseudomonadota bacterium]
MTDAQGPNEQIVRFAGTEGNSLVASYYPAVESSAEEHGRAVALFMHGGGQTRHSWQGAAQKLAGQGVDAFSLDARGHGESDWLESGAYRLDDFVGDLAAVANALKRQYRRAPIVIGASMGGLSAMRLHEVHGTDLFEAVVLVDITPRMERSGVDRIIGFMGERVADGFASVEEAADAIAAYLPGRARPKSLEGLSKNLRQRDNGRYYWHWDPAFVTGKHNITHKGEDSYALLEDAVRKITVPTLLVRGSKSELVSEGAV